MNNETQRLYSIGLNILDSLGHKPENPFESVELPRSQEYQAYRRSISRDNFSLIRSFRKEGIISLLIGAGCGVKGVVDITNNTYKLNLGGTEIGLGALFLTLGSFFIIRSFMRSSKDWQIQNYGFVCNID